MTKRLWAAVTLAPVVGFGRAQSPSKPAIDGEIDAPKALKLLYSNYDEENGRSLWTDDRLKEYFRDDSVYVREYTVHEAAVEGRRQWFLYTVASPAHDEYYNCHACSLLLGAAMFEKQDRGWVNKAHTPMLAMVGNLGVPPNEPKHVQWGRQAFGLVIEDGWTGYGKMTTFQTLFASEKGRFHVIFNVRLFYDNGASMMPKSQMVGWEEIR